MIDKMLSMIGASFPMTELDCSAYSKMKVSGMTFQIRRFHAEGLGSVSSMVASGFLGLMKMDTLIITPTEKDMPLFSYDRVHAMGNDTLILELYDTLLGEGNLGKIQAVNKKFNALPDHDLGTHWYDSIKLKESASKKGKKAQTAEFDAYTEEYFKAYLDDVGQMGNCDSTAKKEKASVYVEGLLSNGGPSTDVFKGQFGEEKTADLFRRILFGTK